MFFYLGIYKHLDYFRKNCWGREVNSTFSSLEVGSWKLQYWRINCFFKMNQTQIVIWELRGDVKAVVVLKIPCLLRHNVKHIITTSSLVLQLKVLFCLNFCAIPFLLGIMCVCTQVHLHTSICTCIINNTNSIYSVWVYIYFLSVYLAEPSSQFLLLLWEVLMPRVVLIQQVETKFISSPIKEQILVL